MSTRRVVIDDTDPRIKYTGSGWFISKGNDAVGTQGPTYLGSQHAFKSGQGLITFTFEGTSVDVYGTNGQVPFGGQYDPKWGCHVDSQAVSPRSGSSDVENNWPICQTDGLSAGEHTLVVDITAEGDGAFYFDRIMYTPSGGFPDGSAIWMAFSDPAVVYDDNWVLWGSRVTDVHGASVSLSFTGSSLTWVGEIPADSSTSPASLSYSIDGGSAVTVSMAGSSSSSLQSNHVWFSTSDFSSGSHSLKVTYNGNKNVPLSLAYVYLGNSKITTGSTGSSSQSPSVDSSQPSGPSSDSVSSPLSPTLSLSSTSPLASSPSNSSSSRPVALGSSTTSLEPQQVAPPAASTSAPVGSGKTNTPSQQASTQHSTTPWIIVAGVCGGLFLLLLLGVLFFFIRRRRQRKASLPTSPSVIPFMSASGAPSGYIFDTANKEARSAQRSSTDGATSIRSTQTLPKENSSRMRRTRDTITSLGAPPSYTQ
ncbi:hypothetical protein DXG01_016022 [Tephrocybe rancida]|nr:hypothetical protein DXG01_016022 [Tephrocybe rancida]